MNLFFRKSGSGEPLIILHGLYGSSDNWYSIGRELSSSFTVYLVDQRNHGNSPHSPVHNYNVLSNDINEFMDSQQIPQAFIMGHSMGGKTALTFGLQHPEKIKKMIVVDISPLNYNKDKESTESKFHKQIIGSLQNIDLANLKSREDAEKDLMRVMPLKPVRQFLLKNLKRNNDGTFRWTLNLQALAENMTDIFAGNINENDTDPRSIPEFPLLFIKGELSGYIRPRDEEAIRQFFPWAGIKVIQEAGHWIHAEQPRAFLETVKLFLKS
jgi:pimeloyl-ACP methyl ester carboxylesterase